MLLSDRKRTGKQRKRDPDLPSADQKRRTCDGYPSGYHPLFYDDTGSGKSGAAVRGLRKGGEIFILDMGEPVKILDLAKKMIRLSGHVPGEDIKIEFTGLRPGEKLYEELLISDDNLVETENDRIFVAQMGNIDVDETGRKINRLIERAYDESRDIREEIKEIVPEYRINGEQQ